MTERDAVILLCAAIKLHYEGDEQKLDVLADTLAAELNLSEAVTQELANREYI